MALGFIRTPEGWEFIKDEFDTGISFTYERDDTDIIAIDVFESSSCPALSTYAESNLHEFIEELPFGFKISGEIISCHEKKISSYGEVPKIFSGE